MKRYFFMLLIVVSASVTSISAFACEGHMAKASVPGQPDEKVVLASTSKKTKDKAPVLSTPGNQADQNIPQ